MDTEQSLFRAFEHLKGLVKDMINLEVSASNGRILLETRFSALHWICLCLEVAAKLSTHEKPYDFIYDPLNWKSNAKRLTKLASKCGIQNADDVYDACENQFTKKSIEFFTSLLTDIAKVVENASEIPHFENDDSSKANTAVPPTPTRSYLRAAMTPVSARANRNGLLSPSVDRQPIPMSASKTPGRPYNTSINYSVPLARDDSSINLIDATPARAQAGIFSSISNGLLKLSTGLSQSDIDELQRDLERSRNRYKQVTSDVSRLEDELRCAELEKRNQEREVNRLRADYARTKSETEQFTKMVTTEITVLKDQLKKSTIESESLRSKIKFFELRVAELQKEQENMICDYEGRLQTLSQNAELSRAAAEAAAEARGRAAADKDALLRTESLKGDIESVQAAAAAAVAAAEASSSAIIASLRADLSGKATELDSLAADLAGARSQLESTTLELRQNKEQLTLVEHTLKEEQKRAAELAASVDMLSTEKVAVEEALRVSNEGRAAADHDREVAESALVDSNNRVRDLSAQLMQSQQQLEESTMLAAQQAAGATSALSEIRQFKASMLDMKQDIQMEMAPTMNMLQTLSATLLPRLAASEASAKEANARYAKESALRKELHNKLCELRGNIRVLARVRPMWESESANGDSLVVTVPNSEEICIRELSLEEQGVTQAEKSNSRARVMESKSFQFDHVFGPQSTQEAVFEEVQPLVVSALDGFHSCIFAYGQTGSGKTHTMQGPANDPGVNLRALQALFEGVNERTRSKEWEYSLNVSMVEIYNENVVDLLKENSEELEIKQGPNGVHLPGVTIKSVTNAAEVEQLMAIGQANRTIGRTNANEHSSRSHSLLLVDIVGKSENSSISGRLVLVDLAGSERVSKTGAEGTRLNEAKNINRSLSALGDVIHALSTKEKHIPFRNSKLTYLLQDSLGNDNKTLMIVQVSPGDTHRGETICSLNFASRVKKVELGKASAKMDAMEVTRLKADLKKALEHERALEKECHDVKEQHLTLLQKVKSLELELIAAKALSGSVADSNAELAKLNKEATKLKTELAAAKTDVGKLEKQKSDGENEILALKRSLKAMETSLTESAKNTEKLTKEHSLQMEQLKKQHEDALKEAAKQGQRMIAETARKSMAIESDNAVAAVKRQLRDAQIALEKAEAKAALDVEKALKEARVAWEKERAREKKELSRKSSASKFSSTIGSVTNETIRETRTLLSEMRSGRSRSASLESAAEDLNVVENVETSSVNAKDSQLLSTATDKLKSLSTETEDEPAAVDVSAIEMDSNSNECIDEGVSIQFIDSLDEETCTAAVDFPQIAASSTELLLSPEPVQSISEPEPAADLMSPEIVFGSRERARLAGLPSPKPVGILKRRDVNNVTIDEIDLNQSVSVDTDSVLANNNVILQTSLENEENESSTTSLKEKNSVCILSPNTLQVPSAAEAAKKVKSINKTPSNTPSKTLPVSSSRSVLTSRTATPSSSRVTSRLGVSESLTKSTPTRGSSSSEIRQPVFGNENNCDALNSSISSINQPEKVRKTGTGRVASTSTPVTTSGLRNASSAVNSSSVVGAKRPVSALTPSKSTATTTASRAPVTAGRVMVSSASNSNTSAPGRVPSRVVTSKNM